MAGGPRVVVSTAAFHARVRGSVPGLGGLKETKMFLPHPGVKVSIVGSLRDREVACSVSDRQDSNFESFAGGQCHLNHLTILWPKAQFSLFTIKQNVRFQERMHLEKFGLYQVSNGCLSTIIHFHMAVIW